MFSRLVTFLVFFPAFMLSACAAQGNLADETWYQVDSAHFTIVTNGDPVAVEELAGDLERFRAVALDLLKARDTGQKLTIYAAADRASYAGLVGEQLAEMTNGLFDTNAQGSYALVNLDGRSGRRQLKAREFLFHEYTHFLSYDGTTTHYPYWYSEGFAEFMSTMTFTADGGYQIGAIPAERANTLLYTSHVPLEQLLTATVQNTPDEEKGRIYASGWMLAHWLIMRSGKVDNFKNYVEAYNRGEDPVKALEKTFGLSLKEIERRYDRQFESGEFNLASGRLPKGFKAKSSRVSQLSQTRAVAEIGRFLVMSGYNLDALQPLVQYARASGVDSAELTTVQAEAETRAGNFSRAQRLLASVPADQRSQFWYQNADAWLWLNREMDKEGKERDRDALKKARDKFVFLVNNDADNASHWYGLALAMEMLDYPRKQYVEMLEQAYLRSPRQVHIAQWLAQELYEQKDAEFFARVAQPLLMDLGSEEEYQQMKMMLAELKPKEKSGEQAEQKVN